MTVKFNKRYSYAKHGQEFIFEEGLILYFNEINKCGYCGKPTHFVEASFKCGMCSQEYNCKM